MTDDGAFSCVTDKGEYLAQTVIIAAGVTRVRPGIANIADYEGKGVSYCVSCDGFFFRGCAVVVVGEGNYAANQALELTNFTPKVTILTQGKTPEMGDSFADRLAEAGIGVSTAKIETLTGNPALTGGILEDGSELAFEGLFVAMLFCGRSGRGSSPPGRRRHCASLSPQPPVRPRACAKRGWRR